MGRVARTLSPVSGSGDPQSWTGLGHQILLEPTNRWSPGQTLIYPHTALARLDDNSRAPSTLAHEIPRATWRGWSYCLAILQMRKLRLENLPKLVSSTVHKSCHSSNSQAVSPFRMTKTRSKGEPSQLPSCQRLSQTAVIPQGTKPRLHDPSCKVHLPHALIWGVAGALRFLNETVLLCRQLG